MLVCKTITYEVTTRRQRQRFAKQHTDGRTTRTRTNTTATYAHGNAAHTELRLNGAKQTEQSDMCMLPFCSPTTKCTATQHMYVYTSEAHTSSERERMHKHTHKHIYESGAQLKYNTHHTRFTRTAHQQELTAKSQNKCDEWSTGPLECDECV